MLPSKYKAVSLSCPYYLPRTFPVPSSYLLRTFPVPSPYHCPQVASELPLALTTPEAVDQMKNVARAYKHNINRILVSGKDALGPMSGRGFCVYGTKWLGALTWP